MPPKLRLRRCSIDRRITNDVDSMGCHTVLQQERNSTIGADSSDSRTASNKVSVRIRCNSRSLSKGWQCSSRPWVLRDDIGSKPCLELVRRFDLQLRLGHRRIRRRLTPGTSLWRLSTKAEFEDSLLAPAKELEMEKTQKSSQGSPREMAY